jgi:T5SS/PEP-CTERM-associated repeat protein
VANGATLKGGTVYVAETTGSTGAATVTGNGSVAQLGELLVGYNGSGNLTVASGGNVTCGNVTLGAESGAQGTLNVTGSNSVLQASGAVGVLIGSMSVTNNATMTVGSGFDVSAGQSALVDGASQLTAAGTFTLVGNLTVSNGSAVNGALGMTVDAAGAAATVLVTGTNTTFGVGLMTVGEKGNGNVTVANGATLTGGGAGTGNGNGSSSGPFIVGQNAGSSGVVSLNPGTPAGNATWSVGTNMFVGYSGAGQVSLGNQSLLEADNLIVGTTSGSSGILTLTAGSQVSVSGGMEMAEQSGAAAAVTFNGGGVVNVAQGLQFVGLSGSTLTMNVTGTASGTQYGVFNVTGGNCLLGGNFVVTLGGNYVPTLGDTFQFFNVTGGNIQGIFANYNLPTLSGNLGWDVSNLTTNGTISVVAGPGVGTPPTFTLFPMNATVRAGGNVTFSAGATASGLVTYQWEKNSVPISGATNSTLTLTNVSAANAGNYAVVATSAGQSFLSGTAVLTVTAAAAPPKITKQPVAQSVKAGATVTIKVTATGTAPLKYAWQRNSKNLVNGKTISGVATATLKLTKVTSAANGGTYRVIVSNAAGKVTSTAVKLTVKAAAKK